MISSFPLFGFSVAVYYCCSDKTASYMACMCAKVLLRFLWEYVLWGVYTLQYTHSAPCLVLPGFIIVVVGEGLWVPTGKAAEDWFEHLL